MIALLFVCAFCCVSLTFNLFIIQWISVSKCMFVIAFEWNSADVAQCARQLSSYIGRGLLLFFRWFFFSFFISFLFICLIAKQWRGFCLLTITYSVCFRNTFGTKSLCRFYFVALVLLSPILCTHYLYDTNDTSDWKSFFKQQIASLLYCTLTLVCNTRLLPPSQCATTCKLFLVFVSLIHFSYCVEVHKWICCYEMICVNPKTTINEIFMSFFCSVSFCFCLFVFRWN